jgi:hypothetical protein
MEKKRKENWSKGEVETLMTGYIENHTEIESKFSLKVTAQVKETCWQDILERYTLNYVVSKLSRGEIYIWPHPII